MYPVINGWTKETMKARIREHNNGNMSWEGDNCAYFSSDGNRCAAGCFIDPEDYWKGMEGESIRSVTTDGRGRMLLEKFPLSVDGMSAMQREHDDCVLEQKDMRDLLCEWIDNNVMEK